MYTSCFRTLTGCLIFRYLNIMVKGRYIGVNLGAIMSLIIIAVMLSLSLKKYNPEISSVISIGICIVIISICVGRIGVILDTFRKISEYIKIDNGYLIILLKLLGIAYICEFASGISKDAGYSAVASQIELVGKLTMLMVSLPVLVQVIETVVAMLG